MNQRMLFVVMVALIGVLVVVVPQISGAEGQPIEVTRPSDPLAPELIPMAESQPAQPEQVRPQQSYPAPTTQPTAQPTSPGGGGYPVPTDLPTAQPTTQPTTQPTGQPTTQPTAQPTSTGGGGYPSPAGPDIVPNPDDPDVNEPNLGGGRPVTAPDSSTPPDQSSDGLPPGGTGIAQPADGAANDEGSDEEPIEEPSQPAPDDSGLPPGGEGIGES